jgi:hypothetical protein
VIDDTRYLTHDWYLAPPLLVWLACLWIGNAAGISPGKAITGLRVVGASTGRRPGVGPGLARALLSLLSVLAGGLGLWWALARSQRRAWHDRWTDTVVIRHTARARSRWIRLLRGFVTLAVIVGVLSVTIVAGQRFAQTTTFSVGGGGVLVNRTSGKPGSAFRVFGRNWPTPPDHPSCFVVQWDDTVTLETTCLHADGSFDVTLRVPPTAALGAHRVQFVSMRTGTPAFLVRFSVTR